MQPASWPAVLGRVQVGPQLAGGCPRLSSRQGTTEGLRPTNQDNYRSISLNSVEFYYYMVQYIRNLNAAHMTGVGFEAKVELKTTIRKYRLKVWYFYNPYFYNPQQHWFLPGW